MFTYNRGFPRKWEDFQLPVPMHLSDEPLFTVLETHSWSKLHPSLCKRCMRVQTYEFFLNKTVIMRKKHLHCCYLAVWQDLFLFIIC